MSRPIVFDAFGTLFELMAAAMPVLDRFETASDSLFVAWRDL